MTVRLVDIQEQKRYERERETYELQVDKRMEQPPSSDPAPWPTMPKPPEPLLDSREGGTPKRTFDVAFFGGGTRGQDPRPSDVVDRDGTSQSEVKGFDSAWSKETASSPFKLKK